MLVPIYLLLKDQNWPQHQTCLVFWRHIAPILKLCSCLTVLIALGWDWDRRDTGVVRSQELGVSLSGAAQPKTQRYSQAKDQEGDFRLLWKVGENISEWDPRDETLNAKWIWR